MQKITNLYQYVAREVERVGNDCYQVDASFRCCEVQQYVGKFGLKYLDFGGECVVFNNADKLVIKVFRNKNITVSELKLKIMFYMHQTYRILFPQSFPKLKAVVYPNKNHNGAIVQELIERANLRRIGWVKSFEVNVIAINDINNLPSSGILFDSWGEDNFLISCDHKDVYVDRIEMHYTEVHKLFNIVRLTQEMFEIGDITKWQFQKIKRYVKRIYYFSILDAICENC